MMRGRHFDHAGHGVVQRQHEVIAVAGLRSDWVAGWEIPPGRPGTYRPYKYFRWDGSEIDVTDEVTRDAVEVETDAAVSLIESSVVGGMIIANGVEPPQRRRNERR